MDALVRLGELFKERRSEKGLSLKAFGKICGESDSCISKLERGKLTKPDITKVLEVGKKLDIQPSEICHVLGYSDDVRLKSISCLNDDDVVLAQAFIDFLLSRHAKGIGGESE